jgi:hypothetical protein
MDVGAWLRAMKGIVSVTAFHEIAQIRTNRQLWLRKIIRRLYGANLFIAGLLYLLCFEHVDNSESHIISSETVLLIPSVRQLWESSCASTRLLSRVLNKYDITGLDTPTKGQVLPVGRPIETYQSNAVEICNLVQRLII